MGISITALQTANLTWVLANQQFLLFKVPGPGEKIEIETWPSALSKVLCRRDFTIRNSTGEVVGHSITDWAIVNMQTRKAERVPNFISKAYPSEELFALPKLNLKPAPLTGSSKQAIFSVKHEDTDINEHLTNTRYVDFMLDSVPTDARKTHRSLFFDIIYRAESLEGDRIESRLMPANFDEIKGIDHKFTSLLPNGEIKAYWHNLVRMKKSC